MVTPRALTYVTLWGTYPAPCNTASVYVPVPLRAYLHLLPTLRAYPAPVTPQAYPAPPPVTLRAYLPTCNTANVPAL
ncbi:hypothetical protein RRG08_067193 [Elysia crispata]|uniref:Uncharacterized protein n=1 Tax=Elysia crispata TaxID=231223 RepID=A0AAE1D5S2_9GAST|nr:hypothetical protein RRG08_067193 [Elysia crispata]